ncbi:sulfatase [Lutimonas saemankumensis]|uniref:sulfatase n=1 Tax=Lutimonas saemankumensis TaxID=483016 RepID=UPI001CD6642F|nr:sulfatase [Lutimonas saemankumensis]MCA0932480.1 sulfatase [Lutimonas saemankumensis]
MKIRDYTFILLICLGLGTSFTSAQEKQPNILFIAIDDMNDWTGFLGGHPETITPNMDKLAKKGVNFTNAHTSAPGCSPSRNALLYGIQPFKSGLYPFYEHDIHRELMEKYTSLPRLLKENGYLTFGAGKIHHGNLSDTREWTEFHKTKANPKRFKEGEGYVKGNNKKYSFRPTINPDEEHIDHQVASYGIEKLNEKHDKPFFLAVGIVKPHLPFDAPVRFFDALPDQVTPPEVLENDSDDIPAVGRSLQKRGEYNHYLSKGVWNEVRKSYLACISWADYNIGRVLDALEKSDYADNTVVVLWSDHGYHLGEKKTFKKFTLWEEATRVPFIIYDTRTKGKENADNYTDAVSLINVYKTIADYTGVQIPDYVDGESLVPIVKGHSEKLKNPTIIAWGRGNYSVRSKTHRYTRYFDGGEELYDHQNDPNEWKNLAKDEKFEVVKQELSAYLPSVEEPMVSDFVSPWSIEGADKAAYKKKKGTSHKKTK